MRLPEAAAHTQAQTHASEVAGVFIRDRALSQQFVDTLNETNKNIINLVIVLVGTDDDWV